MPPIPERVRVRVKTVYDVMSETTNEDGSKQDVVLATFDTEKEAQDYKKTIDDPPIFDAT